jgi:hypothetical protein
MKNAIVAVTTAGFVAVRLRSKVEAICKVVLKLPVRRIDRRRTDGFREHISSAL